MELKKAVALRLKALLEEKGLSKEELALQSELPLKTVQKILDCEYQRVGQERVFVLSHAMGISLSEFYNDPLFDEHNLINKA